MTLPQCIHMGRQVRPGYVECSSDHFAGPNFKIRSVAKVCLKPCPFINKPNLNRYVQQPEQTAKVGTELHNLLTKMGIHYTANCECAKHVAEMDRNGPEWCRQNIERIVGWLRKEANKRSIPFVAPMARLLIRRAIRNAEKKASQNQPSLNPHDNPPSQ